MPICVSLDIKSQLFQLDKMGYGRSPKITRHIPAAPSKILDAPGENTKHICPPHLLSPPSLSCRASSLLSLFFTLCRKPELIDDYYLNLLSWSKQNVLAVALGRAVYLWNADNGAIEHLVTLNGSEDCITSVSWMEMVSHHHHHPSGYLLLKPRDLEIGVHD